MGVNHEADAAHVIGDIPVPLTPGLPGTEPRGAPCRLRLQADPSLDGEGVRSILTLGILRPIESLLRERHGDDPAFRLCDYFDLSPAPPPARSSPPCWPRACVWMR